MNFIPWVLVAFAAASLGRYLRTKYVQSKMPPQDRLNMLVAEAEMLQSEGVPDDSIREQFRNNGLPKEVVDVILSHIGIEPRTNWMTIFLLFAAIAAMFLFILNSN